MNQLGGVRVCTSLRRQAYRSLVQAVVAEVDKVKNISNVTARCSTGTAASH